jgi:large subunit ribosomal protein L25
VLSVEGIPAGTQFLASQVPLPDGVTLISDPELLVVNVIPAPTAADLDAEGGGETAEAPAAEDSGEAEGEAAETESA